MRWVQYGVFSPINRLHSSCNDFQRKEPWSYGKEAEAITKEYLRLRHALFPYIYTMNYRTHKDLLPLVQPMYYSHPKCGNAYDVPNQYWFGSELIVCPITEKRNANSNHGSANAWLPSGDWFDFQKGLHYYSVGRKFKTYRTLEEMPVFAKAGAIVPMETRKANDNHLGGSDNMNGIDGISGVGTTTVKKKKTSTRKYICSGGCGCSFRATKDLNVMCLDCMAEYVRIDSNSDNS